MSTAIEPRKRHAYWLEDAFKHDTSGLLSAARVALATVDFDTIVCMGLSGMLVAPIIWRGLQVPHLAVVRKDGETPVSHSDNGVEGAIGAKWLFVDDFVASGRTRDHVKAAVADYHPESQYVGAYQYRPGRFAVPGADGSDW